MHGVKGLTLHSKKTRPKRRALQFERLAAPETHMHATINAIKELLASSTSQTIEVVTIPTNRMLKDVLYLWPWRIDEESSGQRLPPNSLSAPVLPILRISCLAFAADLNQLEAVRKVIFQNPVLVGSLQRVTVQPDPLDATLLIDRKSVV